MVEFEIMDMLVSMLCPTSEAASHCQDFISASNHQVLAPFGPIIYFLFFPVIFLLLFVYIASGSVLRRGTAGVKGIRLLIGLGLLVYIVISGLYPVFLWLGELWFVVIFILAFFYFLVHHWGGDKVAGGAMPGAGGGLAGLTKGVSAGRALKKVTGMEGAQAAHIEAQIELLENTPKGSHGMESLVARISAELKAFGGETSFLGQSVASDYKRLFERFKKACKEKNAKV